MLQVGLVFGGRSVEHRVSVISARTIAQGLAKAGHRVVPLAIAMDGSWASRGDSAALLAGQRQDLPVTGLPIADTLDRLSGAELDVVFPIVHGTWGEDGTLQGLCEMLDLPYVGTDVATSAVAMDKVLSKQVLAASGIAVVDAEIADRRQGQSADEVQQRCQRLGWPLFVKPAIGGSSVGVSKVPGPHCLATALEEGFQFADRLVIERAIVGRELECGVLGYRQIEASEIGEIVPGKEFYDYADKYLDEGARLIAPAELDGALAEELRATAIAAFTALGGHGFARVDFLLENASQKLFVNEVNTLPGFTEISMFPRLWQLSGVPLPDLVERLLRIALDRYHDRQRLDAGIKDWIDQLAGG